MKKPIIVEFAGPSGVGKTTIVKKVEKIDSDKTIKHVYGDSLVEKIVLLPKSILFCTAHPKLVKEIFKSSTKKIYFVANCRNIVSRLIKARHLVKKAIKSKSKKVYYCDNFPHAISYLVLRGRLNKTNNLLKIIDELYYSKYKVIFVYKDAPVKEIIKRRCKRKNKSDMVSEKKLVKETEDYEKVFFKVVDNISDDVMIKTTSDDPKIIEERINKEKNRL